MKLSEAARDRIEQAVIQAAILAVLQEFPEGLTEDAIREEVSAVLRRAIGLKDTDIITRSVIDPTLN